MRGIKDEEQLSKFLAEVSLPQLGGQVVQIGIVGVSAWVGAGRDDRRNRLTSMVADRM